MKHIMRNLKGTKSVKLQYTGSESLSFHGFMDSDFAGDQATRKSTSGRRTRGEGCRENRALEGHVYGSLETSDRREIQEHQRSLA
jgi:hypothetical protein